MSNSATITAAQIGQIATVLGSIASLFVPGAAAIAAVLPVATGAVNLIDSTLLPILQSMKDEQITVAEQALVAARTAIDEARFGATPVGGAPKPA